MARPARFRLAAVLAAALAAVTLIGAGTVRACADVVRLRTGETVKGRVLPERTNEQILTIEDYVTGTVRELAWDVLTPEDREQWHPMKGVGGSLVVKCESITYKVGDTTQEIRGVVEKDDGTALWVRVRGNREAQRIDKSRIVGREEDECDPTEIWSPEELADRRKAEAPAEDARGHHRNAIYFERIGAFAEAKEAYEAAAADEGFLNRASAQAGAERMTKLLADRAALETLGALRTNLSFNQFKSVRDGIQGFDAKHPSAGDAAKKQLEDLKAAFEKKRTSFFSAEAGRQFVPLCKKMIEVRVRPKEAQLNEVLGYAKKDLPKEAFEELAKRFQQRDPEVTAELAETYWKARPKRAAQWSYARYGSGSFIIEPPTVKPSGGGGTPRPQPRGGSGRGGSGSQPAPQITIPKPPTRDGWWAAASAQVRGDWIFASFVEKSPDLFEVAPQRDKSPCDGCGGAGLISKTTTNGELLSYLCPRCGGSRYDLTVKYR